MNVIITGAGKGIGLELTRLFAKNNHKVLAISRNLQSLENLSGVYPISFDLSNRGELNLLIDKIKQHFGTVDILVNNAGALANKPYSNLNYEDFRLMYDTNVYAPFMLVQSLLPYFGNKAHIVNIGSMGGVHGTSKYPGLSLYSSSKAALACLTESMATELSHTSFRFNCLALGAVQTEMFSEAFPGFTAPVTPLQMADYIYDFTLNGGNVINGKIIPVALSNP